MKFNLLKFDLVPSLVYFHTVQVVTQGLHENPVEDKQVVRRNSKYETLTKCKG